MPTLRLPEGAFVDRERAVDDVDEQPFDRAAFARRALELVGTPNTTVAICEGSRRLRVESGRVWRRGSRDETRDETDTACGVIHERWALLAISPTASRRAIALAVAELARVPRAYALDLLLHESGS